MGTIERPWSRPMILQLMTSDNENAQKLFKKKEINVTHVLCTSGK